MIRWVPFSLINERHLEGLARCLLIVPAEVRHDLGEVMKALKTGALRLFEFDSGVLLVHREGDRLVIDAMEAKIWQRRELADVLRRLAADWLCDKVQTSCFDKRLADAIVAIGGRVESWDLTLEVGQGNDHEEDEQD